jgi:hypothetical protein
MTDLTYNYYLHYCVVIVYGSAQPVNLLFNRPLIHECELSHTFPVIVLSAIQRCSRIDSLKTAANTVDMVQYTQNLRRCISHLITFIIS